MLGCVVFSRRAASVSVPVSKMVMKERSRFQSSKSGQGGAAGLSSVTGDWRLGITRSFARGRRMQMRMAGMPCPTWSSGVVATTLVSSAS